MLSVWFLAYCELNLDDGKKISLGIMLYEK